MAAPVRTCPKCGGPLTAAAGEPARLACKRCGVGFAARPRKPVAVAAGGRSRLDPTLKPALFIGGGLALVLSTLFAAIAAALWQRGAHEATPVAVATVSIPSEPAVADRPADPAPAKPPPADNADPTPPRKPALPAEAPPAPLPAPLTPTPPPEPDLLPPAAPKPADKPATLDGKVDQAVTRAVAYLKGRVHDGLQGDHCAAKYPTGVMALIGLALLEAGVPADDPDVQKLLSEVRAHAESLTNTYEMSLCVWFLDRLGDPRDEEAISSLAVRLIGGQLFNGLWEYKCPAMTAEKQKELLDVLNKYDAASPIPGAAELPPVCLYHRGKKVDGMKPPPGAPPPRPGTHGPSAVYGDLSLTQFAVLALWAARKHSVPVDRSLLLTEAHCRGEQAADGSWAYRRPGDYMRDSMTCAGLMALAVGRGVGPARGTKPALGDAALDRALPSLADVFTRAVPVYEKANVDALRKAVDSVRLAYGGPLWKRVDGKDVGVAPADLPAFEEAVQKALGGNLPDDTRQLLQEVRDAAKAYGMNRSTRHKQELVEAVEILLDSGALGEGDRFLKARPLVDYTWDDIYFLWSLERMAVVYDFHTVAGHDWYAWGADLLIAYQRDDGSWVNAYGGPVDTSLALLFLKRANVAKDLTARIKAVAPLRDLPAATTIKSEGESPGVTQGTASPGRFRDAPRP